MVWVREVLASPDSLIVALPLAIAAVLVCAVVVALVARHESRRFDDNGFDVRRRD